MFGFLKREALAVFIGNILVVGKFPGCSGGLQVCYQASYPKDHETEWVIPNSYARNI